MNFISPLLRMGEQARSRMHHWIAKEAIHQVRIMLLAFPLYVCWGLPIALLSCVGNIIFTPLLTLFLCASFLFTLCFYCSIPYGWIVWCIELIATFWLKLLSMGSRLFLLFCPCPSYGLAIVCFVLMVCIMHHRWLQSHQRVQMLCLCLLVAFFWIGAWMLRSDTYLPLGSREHVQSCLLPDGGVQLVFEGKRLKHKAIDSWVEYTVRQHLARTYGSVHINQLCFVSLSREHVALITSLVHQGLVHDGVVICCRVLPAGDFMEQIARVVNCFWCIDG